MKFTHEGRHTALNRYSNDQLLSHPAVTSLRENDDVAEELAQRVARAVSKEIHPEALRELQEENASLYVKIRRLEEDLEEANNLLNRPIREVLK